MSAAHAGPGTLAQIQAPTPHPGPARETSRLCYASPAEPMWRSCGHKVLSLRATAGAALPLWPLEVWGAEVARLGQPRFSRPLSLRGCAAVVRMVRPFGGQGGRELCCQSTRAVPS